MRVLPHGILSGPFLINKERVLGLKKLDGLGDTCNLSIGGLNGWGSNSSEFQAMIRLVD